jgi:protein-tyrosine-phosphatase
MKIVFICIANSARSQMAEAIARAMAPKGVEIMSAGSAPKRVHPLAMQAMEEVGLDISRHRAKHFKALPENIDVVIRLCAEENCPVFWKDGEQIHWPISDPAQGESSVPGGGIDAFRKAREELRDHLRHYFRRMDDSPGPSVSPK